ncbi:hypothetical protein HGG64_00945 [Mycoplasma phocoeninasale]|uniref:Uncharacterized protein n=1 Tax=Mycoplasma phocoeninasale TaxID=2726117 RepID=A0A858U1F4_9MOLU|nr:hypothetical protein [Mycoplasma phocoeninasale]QJG66280.1 hypothetical protein HGG64_00945 [Mycoplasma phocoeninasale]
MTSSKKTDIISGILISLGIMLFALIAIFQIRSIAYDLARKFPQGQNIFIINALIVPIISAILISLGTLLQLKKETKFQKSKPINIFLLVIMILLILAWISPYVVVNSGAFNTSYTDAGNENQILGKMKDSSRILVNEFIATHAILFCGTFLLTASLFWIPITSFNIHKIRKAKNI